MDTARFCPLKVTIRRSMNPEMSEKAEAERVEAVHQTGSH